MKPVLVLVEDNQEVMEVICGHLHEKCKVVKILNESQALSLLHDDVVIEPNKNNHPGAGLSFIHLTNGFSEYSDEIFLQKLHSAIYNNLDDTELNVYRLARCMNMSRSTLFRRIKSITDMAPYELINITRLNKAAQLLTEGGYKIFEVAGMVGFTSQTSFGRNFLKQFGMTPTQYQRQYGSRRVVYA
jgi:AraC-like DNA-binding protein